MAEQLVNSVNANRQAGSTARQAGSTGSPAARKALAQLRSATGKVVGSLFYGTLLKQMRESSEMKGVYGRGGRGEEIFSAQLHGILAERAGAAAHNGLGEALYRSLEQQTRRINDAAWSQTQG